MTQEQHPETATTSYSYYDNGLLSDRTDARNITTHYTYDNVGRPWTISYNDGTTPGITYAYDQNGFTGFLTNINVAGVTTSTLEYFASADLLKKEAVTLNGVSGSFASEYTYDYDGRLLTAKYPSGRTVTGTYDSAGGFASDRLSTIVDGPTSSTLLQSVQDNAAGLITARALSNGLIAETRSFNARNQLTRIAAAANSTTQLDLGYGYGGNNDGRIRLRADSVQPEHSASYTFDEIGRLTAVAGGDSSWGIGWTLDRYGNRTTQTSSGLAANRVGAQTFGYTDNKISGFTGLQYDPAGNLTNEGTGGHVYTYDAENRLTQIDSSAIRYEYDYAGRRIKKTISGTTTYYFYGLTGLMSEFSTSTTISNAAGAAASDRIDYRVGEQTGTAVMLLNSDGTPRENNRVFPFGEPWLLSIGSDNNEKFTTYQRDDASGEAGLDYAMARYYASRSGRFMTSDPGHVGADPSDPQSWNAYTYGVNDPLNHVDPSGQDYRVCVDGFSCFEFPDGDYSYWVYVSQRDHGITLPQDVLGLQWADCGGGEYCVSVEYLDRTSNEEFFRRWLDGSLPSEIYYGQDDPKTDDIRRSATVLRNRQEYIRHACPVTAQIGADHFPAWFESADNLMIGPWNPTQFQVGAYYGQIKRKSSRTVTFTIVNLASNSSFWGRTTWGPKLGLDPNAWNNPNGKKGGRHDVLQIFQWEETDPCL